MLVTFEQAQWKKACDTGASFVPQILLAQKDEKHYTVYKVRRCFLWQNQYFQLDIYQSPCPDK